MPLPVYRLRRLLAVTAVLFTALVAGMYFYARLRARNVLKEVPSKIGYNIKQTARGFQFSNSDGKRTLFTVQATDVKEFKLNGRAELHNVSIVLYGRDSSRFDQIYGDDFAYDPQTENITAKGEVQIDLIANPAGLASPDQSTPKEIKNPIHLKTRDLVFNKATGNATTDARVEFRTAQASGSALGVQYAGKSNTLTLATQVHVVLNGPNAATIDAEHGFITGDPREILLDHPRLLRDAGTLQADRAVFYLNADNGVDRVLATGNVTTQTPIERSGAPAPGDRRDDSTSAESQEIQSRADQAEFLLTGKNNVLHQATLSGNVHVEQTGAQPMQADAGRVILDFTGQNQLQRVHAVDGARLAQKAAGAKKPGATSQDFELTAPVIDFLVEQGHILTSAVTSGYAKITISPAQQANVGSPPPSSLQQTVVTAGKFEAKFVMTEGRDHLSTMHGAPNARIVSSTSGEPDRVSTSESVDAVFLPQGGIDAITQEGNVCYTDQQRPDKRMQAWADAADYTPADQILVLTGNPRVVNGEMATTASKIRINRATGDALAEDEVKTTYSEMKEQPDGALLASSSPIHVTARNMTAHNNGVALYTGDARLWQDANVIEAPSIQFDRDRRFVTALGTAIHPVQTILVQAQKAGDQNNPPHTTENEKTSGKAAPALASSPIVITSALLTYADSERRVHYEGGVLAKGVDFTASSKTMDAYLLPRSQTSTNRSLARPGQLDHVIAKDDVLIRQPNRRAEGQHLLYTAGDDKFVLTGGSPSIFDAEQGKITGVSLTFFRLDDRVLVEGEANTPVVTQTRVAR